MEASSETAESSRHYGKRRLNRACAHCKAAKTKCIVDPENSGGSCERCAHFTLDCVPAVPVVRRRRQERASRVSELEQKLDNIVTLLTNPQLGQPPNLPPGFDDSVPDLWSTPESQDATNYERGSSYDDGGVAVASDLRSGSQSYGSPSHLDEPPFPAEPTLPIRSTRIIATQNLLPPRLQPMSIDADEFLSYYRDNLTEHFMFVVVPKSISARDLRQQKPFLLDSILLAAAKHSVASQRDAGDRLLTYLSEHLLLRGEQSLDLLQGLLVYLAWGNYRFHKSAQMSALLQLAVALVGELDLGKMPRSPPDEKKSLVHAAELFSRVPAEASITHTSNEMRAFLGCFYLSSLFSQCYKKLTGMRYTPYLEHCCKAIDGAAEYPTDVYLTALVRIQLYMCKGVESFPLDESEKSSVAVTMYVKTLQREVQDFRASLSASKDYPSRVCFNLLHVHSYSVEISLLEIGLYDSLQTACPTQILRHLEQISWCLTAAKAFFDHWFEIPNLTYARLPKTVFAGIANATMAASRLVLLEHPGWDLKYAREVLDYGATLGSIASRIEVVTEDLFAGNRGADAEEDLLRYARRMRWVKGWYEKRIVADTEPTESPQITVPVGFDASMMGGDLMNLDNMFWQDFAGEWRGVYGADIPIG